MSNAFAPTLTVTSRARIQRRRDLPIPGEILVALGDHVSGKDVVARAELEGELRVVRVAESLGIPAKDLSKLLLVEEGSRVVEGQPLAEMRGLFGLFRSSIAAPLSGVIEFISNSTGHIGIRAPSDPLNLSAYIPGAVVSIEPRSGLVIETEATFVQGIFGVGGERLGSLLMLPVGCTDPITERDIPEQAAGRILVGGHSPTIGALRKAVAAGAVGLITGSVDDHALRDYVGYDIGVALTGDEDVPMTLIITEGFGALAMSERVFSTLRRVDGQEASINGATQVRAGAQRPEVIAPMSSDETGRSSGDNGLSVGARIRLIRVPYFGRTGVVRELPQELERIETGAWLRVLRAELDDGSCVTVPRANVELV